MAAFSYTNERVFAGNTEGLARVWDLEGLQEVCNYSHKGSITGVDMSSDGDLVASASADQTCAIFSLKYMKVIRNLQFAEHENSSNLPIFGCKFSKSGEILFTVASDRYSYLTQWDMHEFLPIATYRIHSDPITSLSISLDGFFLGIGTSNGWVKIVNARTLDFERNSPDFSGPVTAIGFTYESRHFVACSGDQIKNVFNTRGEGIFSKASKMWVISIFVLWIVLYLNNFN